MIYVVSIQNGEFYLVSHGATEVNHLADPHFELPTLTAKQLPFSLLTLRPRPPALIDLLQLEGRDHIRRGDGISIEH